MSPGSAPYILCWYPCLQVSSLENVQLYVQLEKCLFLSTLMDYFCFPGLQLGREGYRDLYQALTLKVLYNTS